MLRVKCLLYAYAFNTFLIYESYMSYTVIIKLFECFARIERAMSEPVHIPISKN